MAAILNLILWNCHKHQNGIATYHQDSSRCFSVIACEKRSRRKDLHNSRSLYVDNMHRFPVCNLIISIQHPPPFPVSPVSKRLAPMSLPPSASSPPSSSHSGESTGVLTAGFSTRRGQISSPGFYMATVAPCMRRIIQKVGWPWTSCLFVPLSGSTESQEHSSCKKFMLDGCGRIVEVRS
jgi:hypothetical protein